MKQFKSTLKYLNNEKWKLVIESFDTKLTASELITMLDAKKSTIEKAWIEEFGEEKVKERNLALENTILCPVCNQVIAKNKISRHIMNSYGDAKHKEFINKQDERIKEIYSSIKDEELNCLELIEKYNLLCSDEYLYSIFRQFPDYKKRISNKRKIDMSNQHSDGRREKRNFFNNNWVANRETAPNKYISDEQINIIIELFNTDKTQNEIAEIVGCKNETAHKYLVEHFGKEIVAKKGKEIRIKKTTKVTPDIKEKLIKCFYERKTKKEISDELGISMGTVSSFYSKNFSKEERVEREKDIQKKSIKKSLIVCGKNGTTGSKPEVYCYEVLQKELKDLLVIHHDFDICPPFEVDITIPDKKIAISWDGPFHRLPLFGDKVLNSTKKRDNTKIAKLIENNWKIIVVEYNESKFNPQFVEDKVRQIIELVNKDWEGKTII